MLRALIFVLAGTLALAGTTAPVRAQDRDDAVRALSRADPQTRRDAASRLGDVGTMADMAPLVKSLRDADAQTRELAEQAIWEIWARSGDAEVDALYRIGVAQMAAGDLQQSITTFTRVIRQKPDFAEGWNKRATLYFLAGDLRKSLADCDEVMKRNPYHFGALSGYAQIYVHLERYERALEYSRRALEINPNLDGVRRNMELIEQLLEQRRRQSI
jgi:tetratricopeptide (TPR) repeat protein